MWESASDSELELELLGYHDEIRKINQTAEELVSRLSEAQLLWKPEPGAWSIAQCLDHLVATGRTEMPSIRHAIDEGRRRKLFGRGPYHYGPLGWIIIQLMGPDVRFKFRAPELYTPALQKASSDVIRDFFIVQKELLNCIRKANGLDLARTRVKILDWKYIRLSLGQEFKLMVVHEQRHLLQARRIRTHPRFPVTNG